MKSTAITGKRQRFGRLNQAYAYLNMICNANCCDLLELDGDVDIKLLENVVSQVVDRHPMARSVYVRRGPLFDWIHTEHQIDTPIVQQSLATDDESAVHCILLENIWGSGPVLSETHHPLRIFYLRTPGRTFLQIVSSHVYADGRAANILANDIADCYATLEKGGIWGKKAVDIADRSHDRMFLSAVPRFRKAVLIIQAVLGIFGDLLQPLDRLRLDGRRSGRTDLLTVELPDSLLRVLQERTKARGLTIHPFLLIAVLRTCSEYNAERGSPLKRGFRIVDNFSLRRFSSDPAIDELYDCVATPYTITLDARKDDEELLREISGYLERLKSGGILKELYRLRLYYWLAFPLVKTWVTRLACYFFTRSDIICTNVGRLDPRLERFGSIGVRNYFSFPPLFPPGKMMYQISSFRGKMRLLFLFDPELMNIPDAENKFVAPFVKNLERLLVT